MYKKKPELSKKAKFLFDRLGFVKSKPRGWELLFFLKYINNFLNEVFLLFIMCICVVFEEFSSVTYQKSHKNANKERNVDGYLNIF
jgi:hypothetical protein